MLIKVKTNKFLDFPVEVDGNLTVADLFEII